MEINLIRNKIVKIIGSEMKITLEMKVLKNTPGYNGPLPKK